MTFEFDPNKSVANKKKYGIDFVEVQGIWDDPDRLEVPARTQGEKRFVLRARETITSHFRIPSSSQIEPIFTRKILNVGFCYACGCAPSDRLNLPQIWARIP